MADLQIVSRSPAARTRPNPILFVHGAWHSSLGWEENFLPYFAAHGYEVHAVNWRGHGKSPGYETVQRNRIADYVADVAQAASTLKESPILVGHSMGGFVVQKYLESTQAPAGILLASAPPSGTRKKTVKTALHHPGKLLKALLTGRVSLYNTEAGVYQAFVSANMPREQVRRYVSHLQDESLRAFMDMARFPVRTEKVKSPMLVLGAGDDFFIDRHELEQTARAYDTTPEIFPDMAHDMMVEAGWNRVADRMIHWLTTLGL